jgi:hypothetical protein
MLFSDLPYARLRLLLLDLGSDERELDGKYHGFYHAASDCLFAFRRYGPQDKVSVADLVSVRQQLAWRGLVSEQELEASLGKVSA